VSASVSAATTLAPAYNTRMLPLSPASFFPDPAEADPHGLVAIGGQLSPEWLVYAYAHGIFPWPSDDRLLSWWSPDPRAIIEFDEFHIPRSLARKCRKGCFQVTCDRDFDSVIHGCATARDRRFHSWLTPRMQQAYKRLHRVG